MRVAPRYLSPPSRISSSRVRPAASRSGPTPRTPRRDAAAGSGTWASASDRALKTDVARIDDAAVLEKVAGLPISRWSYVSERGVRHVGPMAQDFYAAFGVGEDDKHITSIDEDGVALAAIKALRTENLRLRAQQARLQAVTASQSTQIPHAAAASACQRRRVALGERRE